MSLLPYFTSKVILTVIFVPGLRFLIHYAMYVDTSKYFFFQSFHKNLNLQILKIQKSASPRFAQNVASFKAASIH